MATETIRKKELNGLKNHTNLDSIARFSGYVKKTEVLELLKEFNFLSKDKLIKKIKDL